MVKKVIARELVRMTINTSSYRECDDKRYREEVFYSRGDRGPILNAGSSGYQQMRRSDAALSRAARAVLIGQRGDPFADIKRELGGEGIDFPEIQPPKISVDELNIPKIPKQELLSALPGFLPIHGSSLSILDGPPSVDLFARVMAGYPFDPQNKRVAALLALKGSEVGRTCVMDGMNLDAAIVFAERVSYILGEELRLPSKDELEMAWRVVGGKRNVPPKWYGMHLTASGVRRGADYLYHLVNPDGRRDSCYAGNPYNTQATFLLIKEPKLPSFPMRNVWKSGNGEN